MIKCHVKLNELLFTTPLFILFYSFIINDIVLLLKGLNFCLVTGPELGTLVAVAVGPADGSRVLSEEAPRVGLPVRVPAVAVVAQPPARVLHDVVGKLGPLQTGSARVRLRHGAVVVSQLGESLRAGQRHCSRRGGHGEAGGRATWEGLGRRE